MLPLAPLLASLVVSGSLPPWMTGQSQAEDLRISLVTFSPGDELNDWWGHSGMVVEDTRQNHARLYNYGIFGVGDSEVAFVMKFIKGRLEFMVGEASVPGTFQFYRSLDRDVRVQELELTPPQALELAKALGTNVLPENATYLYQHYTDNCSTRPRDLIDHALGGALSAAEKTPARMGIRAHTRRYSQVNPPMSVMLDFLQNDLLDQPSTQRDEAFLPDELERQLGALQVSVEGVTRPAVRRQWNFYVSPTRKKVPETPPDWRPHLALLALALVGFTLLVGHLGRGGQKVWRVVLGLETALFGLVGGVLGTGLLLMGLFTDHLVTHGNENVFFANPFTLVALPAGLMLALGSTRARHWLRWSWSALALTSVVGVAVKVLPRFDQDNWNVILLLVPVNLAMAALWWLDWRTQQAKPSA